MAQHNPYPTSAPSRARKVFPTQFLGGPSGRLVSRRADWVGALSVLLLLLVVGGHYDFQMRWLDFGTGDWMSYWSVPRGALWGRGFYDLEWLRHLQVGVGYNKLFDGGQYYPVRLLWNLPPSLFLLIPLASLPFTLSTLGWLGLSLWLFGYASLLFNRLLPRPLPPVAALALPLLLLPFLPAFYWGQMGPVVGAFLIFAWVAQRQNKQVAAGLLLLPLLIKPHLVFLSLGLMLVVALRQHQWKLIATFSGMCAY